MPKTKFIFNSIEESLHSVLQGRLTEIGNIRGYHTFCPDKSKKFNEKNLLNCHKIFSITFLIRSKRRKYLTEQVGVFRK